MMKAWAANLASKDGLLRRHSRASLVACGHEATPLLVGLFRDDRNQVRWEAAIALMEIADPDAVDALLHALEDRDDDVRWVAAEALAAIGRPSMIPLMRALIDADHDSVSLRMGAHHVLYKLRDDKLRRLVHPVLDALGGVNPSTEVIPAARQVLEKLETGGRVNA